MSRPAATREEGADVELRQFNVTVRRFDPNGSFERGKDLVLPVDSPDEEHAVSAAMSNAVAFTRKVDGGTVRQASCVARASAGSSKVGKRR